MLELDRAVELLQLLIHQTLPHQHVSARHRQNTQHVCFVYGARAQLYLILFNETFIVIIVLH